MAANSIYWVHKAAAEGLLDGMKPASRFVLFTLAGYADMHKEAWPTVAQISQVTGLHQRTIANIILELVRGEYIDKRLGNHPKREDNLYNNIYTLLVVPDEVAEAEKDFESNLLAEPVGRDIPSGIEVPNWLPSSAINAVPEWFPIPLWIEWETSRKQNKKPMTPMSRKRLAAKLEKFKADNEPFGKAYAIAAVETSIERDWRGVFDLSGNALERFNRDNYRVISKRTYFSESSGTETTERIVVHPDGSKHIKTEKRLLDFDDLVRRLMHDNPNRTIEDAKSRAGEIIASRTAAASPSKSRREPHQGAPTAPTPNHRAAISAAGLLSALESAVGSDLLGSDN